MYKFTNGIVVYDEKTRDSYIKSGMKLISEVKDGKQPAKHSFKKAELTESKGPRGFEERVEQFGLEDSRRNESDESKTGE